MVDVIRRNDVTVLIGETGSGKTTRTSLVALAQLCPGACNFSVLLVSNHRHVPVQRSRNISSKLDLLAPA